MIARNGNANEQRITFCNRCTTQDRLTAGADFVGECEESVVPRKPPGGAFFATNTLVSLVATVLHQLRGRQTRQDTHQ